MREVIRAQLKAEFETGQPPPANMSFSEAFMRDMELHAQTKAVRRASIKEMSELETFEDFRQICIHALARAHRDDKEWNDRNQGDHTQRSVKYVLSLCKSAFTRFAKIHNLSSAVKIFAVDNNRSGVYDVKLVDKT